MKALVTTLATACETTIQRLIGVRMGKHIEHLDVEQGDIATLSVEAHRSHIRIPRTFLFVMVCAILLMDAILPLRDLWFKEALLTQLGWWPVTLSLLLFPGRSLIPPVPQIPLIGLPDIIQSWEQIPLYVGAVLVVFIIYLLALRRLPKLITFRFIRNSTLLFGFLFMLFPIVTSADVFSYIAYARMGVIYHLNPLTTLPTAIQTDIAYKYLSWIDQPSAYGPTWVFLTSAWQWLFSTVRLDFLLPMVLALRVQGLIMHLLSTVLVWSIGGYLQQLDGNISTTKRLFATLAFAWNPLLLFEACVNAHADTTLLTLILLAIWFLARNAAHARGYALPSSGRRNIDRLLANIASDSNKSMIMAAAILALATCLKVNVVLLTPALFMYAWVYGPNTGRFKRIAAVCVIYAGIILLLYAPFWQGGILLHTLTINPAANRSINSPAAFAGHLYNALANNLGYPLGETIGSPAEHITHTLSLGLFLAAYVFLCYRIIRDRTHINSLRSVIGWMAVAWLLYCALGSPWYWPWYIVTFFGLFALIETEAMYDSHSMAAYFVRLLSFSMFLIYCLNSWGPIHSFIPGLPGFEWSYLSGLLIWIIPLVGALILSKVRFTRMNVSPGVVTKK